MKKVIVVMLCIITIFGVIISKIRDRDIVGITINQIEEKENNETTNLDVDIQIYNQLLLDILSSSDISQINDANILTDTATNSINIYYSNKEELVNWNGNESDIDSILELEKDNLEYESEAEQEKYPIINLHGDTYRYGTKEESIESYRLYNEQPLYEILYSEIHINTIKIKIFNRDTRSVQMYSLKIQSDGKVQDFIQII